MSKPTDLRDWSAILEVVLSDQPGKIIRRAKKYPSAAADEVFNPGQGPLKPLIEYKSEDPRSFVFELICSEVFLATFPGNLYPLARLRRELLRKFGNNVGGPDLSDMIKEDVLDDVCNFGQATAISENLGMRRTVLLVPAMTSRCEDYSILGQAAFLASGLTTVFCNAVCGPYGHGQSCFVGHDSWQNGKEDSGTPTTAPYHGVEPGIFQLRRKSGPLRKTEQALVIADVDPVYGTGGRPRPQTLVKPLRLIAHLPVIESWQRRDEAPPAACRCGSTTHSLREVGVFATPLIEALTRQIEGGWKTTMDDSNPKELGDALDQLAKCAGMPNETDQSSRYWLMRRKEAYLAHHRADPNPWPPPVALDWLWVDLGPLGDEKYPTIEVPPYACPPGGETRDQ